jgi:hypothetical protein
MARKAARWIKADPIIPYLQHDSAGHAAQHQVHLARLGLLDGVLQGSLRDTVEVLFDRER